MHCLFTAREMLHAVPETTLPAPPGQGPGLGTASYGTEMHDFPSCASTPQLPPSPTPSYNVRDASRVQRLTCTAPKGCPCLQDLPADPRHSAPVVKATPARAAIKVGQCRVGCGGWGEVKNLAMLSLMPYHSTGTAESRTQPCLQQPPLDPASFVPQWLRCTSLQGRFTVWEVQLAAGIHQMRL